MNINSNELLLLNRNMRFGNAAPQPSTPVAEPPVSKPETGLNALQAQGMNNSISFQGKSAFLQALKNKGLAAMMALSVLAGASTLQSCDDKEIIGIPGGSHTDITITVNYDDEKWQQMYEAMMQMWQSMLEQQQITNTQLIQMNTQMLELMQLVKDGNIDAQEFYTKMFEFMINNEANQQAIIEILTNNGKTQEEANSFIQTLIELVKNGQLSAAEAMDKIMEELGDISGTLKDILEQLQGISEELVSFHNDYNEGKDQTLGLLGDIYEQGTINTQVLLSINDHAAQTSKNLQELQASFEKLSAFLQDDTRYNELMEQLKKLEAGSIDYQKFEDMFKLLGFTLSDVINMSKDELLNAINEFENTYIENEANQNELLQNINNKLNIVVNFPGLDQSAIIDAIKELTNAVNNGNTDVTEELKNIQNQLDNIQKSIDNMMKQLAEHSSMVSSYFNAFKDQFSQALNLLTAISGDMTELKNQQTIANSYLNSLMKEVNELTVVINEIKDATTGDGSGEGSSITIEELENLLKNLNEEYYNKYKTLISNLGIQIGGSTATIEALLKEINEKMNNQKDYTEQLGRILEILEGINLEAPEYTDKLEQIIKLLENFKCNCECGADSGDNEGIVGDLGDLLG